MLNSPKNIRRINPKNCANCAYRKAFDSEMGEMYCDRDPDGLPWDDETDIHYTVCDGFKWPERNKKKRS